MTKLAQWMFNNACEMSILGVQKAVGVLGADMPEASAGSPVTFGPLNPVYWMNVGGELMRQMQQAMVGPRPTGGQQAPAASVLDSVSKSLDGLTAPSNGTPQPAAPVRLQGNGWGPMP
jgi:hypothetical protein